MKKKIILCLCANLICVFAFAQFTIGINQQTGALNKISLPGDQYRMNWIFSSTDTIPTWQKEDQDWGMGKYLVTGVDTWEKWGIPVSKKIAGNTSSFLYKTKYMEVLVERRPAGNDFIETYTFKNTSAKNLNIGKLSIFTPFNDNYPDAKTCATNRCNAHVWPGMYASYVNAIRMDGAANLGLVFTQGAMKSYSINNRGKDGGRGYSSSNVRGTISLNIAPFVLKPKENYRVQWKMFWHKGWEDFYKTAKQSGFVKLEANKYVISKNEKLLINIDATPAVSVKQKRITIVGKELGEHSQRVYYNQGKKYTLLNYLVVSSPQNLIDKRVQFIVSKQQMNDKTDNRYGAYMVYDNELGKIFDKPVGTVSNADRDEGAERLGMGVLVAKWLQCHTDEKVKNSLLRYVDFVRNKLQTVDYKVYSNASKTSRHRAYNYPWVAHLYLETYKITKQKEYLHDYYATLKKAFKEFGYDHYSIDFRVKDGLEALKEANLTAERDTLQNDFLRVADYFVRNGINYPKHEVNYEQSIVAPAVTFLCEIYQVTHDKKYLDAARVQLPSLEAFNGLQPDVHLHDIAIRHWDGFWFGKYPTWGDTLPHYWSTLSGLAFYRYYQCTGDENYRKRAKGIVENNLLNFKENGVASCAYLYPETIDNKQGKFYDAFANDQDWALVFYQEVMR